MIPGRPPQRKSALLPLVPQLDFNSGISWERGEDDRKSPSEDVSLGQIFRHTFDGVFILFFPGVHHSRRPRESAGAEL